MDPINFLQSVWVWLLTSISQIIPVYIIPNFQLIIQIVVLFIIAYITGKIIKTIVLRILGVIGLKRITTQTGAESILKVTGYKGTIVELIGDLVKWIIYILFLALIIQTLGLPGIADIFTQIATFMPRFIGAILIIIIGFIVADFFGKAFEEAGKRFLEEEILSKLIGGVVKYTIALVILIMALSLIGLDTVSLTIMFAAAMAIIMAVIVIGIKDIWPNFTAGIHIKQVIKPGDEIKIGPHSGVVEKIDSSAVILKDRGNRITIPNSIFLKNPIEKRVKG